MHEDYFGVYVEPHEVAEQMIEDALTPYTQDMTRYNHLNMSKPSLAVCMGILKGLYQFETESESEFTNWAADLLQIYADVAIEGWYTAQTPQEAVTEMQTFIENHLPSWRKALKRRLTSLIKS